MGEYDQDISVLLAELKSEGAQDSVGAFTIDPKKAREKFREFGLSAVHEYTCVLVGALVAGGASFIDIEADSDDFILNSDFCATYHELDQLFSLASGGHEAVYFFRLALGLQAALALEPQKVELECWEGETGSRLSLSSEELKVESLQARPWEDERVRSRVHVREKPGLRVLGRFMRKTLKDEATPEQDLLRERCCLSPIPIRLNGEHLNQAPEPSCLAYLVLRPENKALHLAPLLPDVPHREFPSQDFTAYVLLSEDPAEVRAEVILSGLKMSGWTLQHADRVLLYSDTLTTDLSLSNIVEDARLDSIREQIKNALAEVLPDWLEGPLSFANSVPTRDGQSLGYAELQASYERYGFLTVVEASYQGPAYDEAPLVLSGAPYLDLLFPKQVKGEAIPGMLPPGDYRARKCLTSGVEIGLTQQPGPLPGDSRGDFDLRNLRWLLRGEGPEPSIQDILALYEDAPFETIGFMESLELLCYVLALNAPLARTLAELMNEPSGPFELDPESFLSRLVSAQSLPLLSGGRISLEKLVARAHTYWKVFTDQRLHFDKPYGDLVSVPEKAHSGLMKVVGYWNMRNNQDIRTGLIDTSGVLVCEPEAVRRGERVCSGRIEYRAANSEGFTDADGVPIITAHYNHVAGFQEGYAVVRHGQGDYQLMDTQGNLVGPLCEYIGDLHDGLRVAGRGERTGYLRHSGEIAIPFEFKPGGHFGEGEALVTRSGRRFFIDHQGKELRECRSEVEFMGPLKEGLRMAQVDGIWGFVDRDGHWVIRPRFNLTAPPCGGLMPAQLGDRWGLIDTEGSTIVPFRYSWMDLSFSENLIAFGKAEEYGFLDREGQEVLTGFERCGAFCDGLASVQQGGKWGYINHQGEFVIEPKYLSAKPFSEGRAVVSVYNS